MLKNKKLVYLLLPLVLVIWGLIFYRIYANLHGKPKSPSFSKQITKEIDVRDKEEIPQLSLNYPDPFLKNTSISSGEKKTNPKHPDNLVSPINWPMITYRGMLRSEQAKHNVTGFLRVGTTDMLVHMGDVARELAVLRIAKDSILLENKGEKRWFRLTGK